jgi:hypothetical protein
MKLAIEILVYGVAVPGAVAFAIVWMGLRRGSLRVLARSIEGVAVAAAFFLGCVLTLGRDAVVPTRHWQWLPWVTVLAGVTGTIVPEGVYAKNLRWLFLAALAIIAAWLIVPTRPTLWPPRPISIALVSAYFFVIMALLDVLPEQLLGKAFLAQLAMAAGTVAVLLVAEISMTFGQLGLAAAAGLGGAWAASCFSNSPVLARSVIPAFAVVTGGLAYIGCIGCTPPLLALLLVPAAPLCLFAFAYGPLSRLRGVAGGALQTAMVMALPIIAVAWIVLRGE